MPVLASSRGSFTEPTSALWTTWHVWSRSPQHVTSASWLGHKMVVPSCLPEIGPGSSPHTSAAWMVSSSTIISSRKLPRRMRSSGSCYVGCGHHLRWTSLPLLSLLVCLLKGASTSLSALGSTAERAQRTTYAPTLTLQFTTTLTVMKMCHLSDVVTELSDTLSSLSFQPAFLKATTEQEMHHSVHYSVCVCLWVQVHVCVCVHACLCPCMCVSMCVVCVCVHVCVW